MVNTEKIIEKVILVAVNEGDEAEATRRTLPNLDIPLTKYVMYSSFGTVETGGAWLSSARVVRCWVKSRNERNPCP